jgi:hypothetical protein
MRISFLQRPCERDGNPACGGTFGVVRAGSSPSVEWLEDVTGADWIGPRLHPFGEDTGSIVPEGFDAYARLLHPVESHRDERRCRWADIAAENGRAIHSEILFEEISRPPVGATGDNDWGEPRMGSLAPPEREVLVDILRPATATPEACWFCVWDGFGGLDDQGVTARVRLPARDYLLRRGPIEAALQPTPHRQGPGFGVMVFTTSGTEPPALPEVFWEDQSPNLWWPTDRAWIVATEIDLTWTYIGGTAALIRSILDHPDLESLPAELTDWPFRHPDDEG